MAKKTKPGKKAKAEIKSLTRKLGKARKKLAKRAAAPSRGAPARSPLAPPGGFPDLPAIAAAEFAATEAGVRATGRRDVMLARLAPGTAIAGVFTRSATRAAPVLDCQAKLAAGAESEAGAAILVNSGNANAFTGRDGEAAVAELASAAATACDLPEARVFTASTGVIGETLPADRIAARIPELADGLSADGLPAAAEAIRTTDTFPKGAGTEIEIDGAPVRIAGIAKGSGMIAPDMATMLAYIFTDAEVPQPALQRLLAGLADETFNRITVDGDTSTSDTVMLAATGAGPAPAIGDLRSRPARAFRDALRGVMRDLAQQIVRDGEGATKFAEIAVTGAAGAADARRVADAVATSPLVKTALAGSDPNWGRIVMAVGKAGARADRDRLTIRFGDITVARDGRVADTYVEAEAAAYMANAELVIGIDLGLGTGASTVWTCDLTRGYIDINADYRT